MTTTNTIWKFTLELRSQQTIKMPLGAKILCAQTQREMVCLWATVNPDAPLSDRRFVIAGTGHVAPDEATHQYIGTVQVAEGGFCLSCFREHKGGIMKSTSEIHDMIHHLAITRKNFQTTSPECADILDALNEQISASNARLDSQNQAILRALKLIAAVDSKPQIKVGNYDKV